MSNQNVQEHIIDCQDHLSQGDIFLLDLVAPMADPDIRIFRTEDGTHLNIADEIDGRIRVFTPDELTATIRDLSPDQRRPPFHNSIDGIREMVLVYADLLKYFMIISQTCDISGVDSDPKPTCSIIPITTLAQFCQQECLPLQYRDPATRKSKTEVVNITDYFAESFDPSFRHMVLDDSGFPEYLRQNIKTWQKGAGKNGAKQVFLSKIRNALRDITQNRRLYSYYIKEDKDHEIPECFADFLRIYTIRIEVIQSTKDARIGMVTPPFRDQLVQKFAHYYQRIATPYAMKGEPIG
jgi:hypothetical protein